MSSTIRRITTAIVASVMGGVLYVGTGIGWDVAPATAAGTHTSVVANGIGWD
ncbi:hypothetical protein [Streptomyces sp. NPDC096033]|uniref:hypothetical protein n=1 Tax=Streptomyces sp. NPDC096033 TaxID=3366071 RepID=UPI0037F6DD6B